MRILVSGAGPSGLTVATWLARNGHDPIVVERWPQLRDDGYGIDFFGTGYDVAERMGLIDELADGQLFAGTTGAISFVDADGSPRATLDLAEVRRVLDDRYLPLMHGRLVDALHGAAVDAGVEIRFDTTITAIDQDDDGVRVALSDGTAEEVDLVVGADGVHSNVRGLAFGPERDYAHFLGYRVASYFLTGEFDRSAMWDNYVEPGREVGLYSSDDPDRLVALFLWEDDDDTPIPADQRLDVLHQTFGDAAWHTAQILAAAPDDPADVFMDTVTQIRMDTWRNGRVVLVGDAAGCMTLVSGQGASMALATAYVLAEELGQGDDWRQALATYEHRARPQVELRQHNARSFAKQFVPGSRLGVAAQAALMKVITRPAFSGLLKSQFVGDSFLATAALHRLPDSHDGSLGFAISGHLHTTDYTTLQLALDEALQERDTVDLLLAMDGLTGIDAKALWADWQLARHVHDRIGRIAVVGDHRLAQVVTHLTSPFHARRVRHFATADTRQAWEWLDEVDAQR